MVSQEIEDALLGVECHQSSVSSNPRPTTEENTSDPLQAILKRLDDMQGQLTALKNRNSEVSTSIASILRECYREDDKHVVFFTPNTVVSNLFVIFSIAFRKK